jgi:archaellum component FlaC
MSIENRTFTLVGRFDDKITKSLQKVNSQLKELQNTVKSFNKNVSGVGKNFEKMARKYYATLLAGCLYPHLQQKL